jgi:hypothetical protein
MARVLVPVTEITPPKAAHTTALTGTHNDLVFTARTGGPGGNSLRIAYIVAGASTPLSVVVTGYDITVNVQTDGASAAVSTATDVLTAIRANFDANRLVTVALAAANDGTGIVVAFALTALAGGSFQTTPPTQVDGDATNGNYLTGNDGLTTIEVVSSDGSSRTVTLFYSPYLSPNAIIPGQVETIPAGATRILGPFPNATFDQTGTQDLYFTPSVSTTLKFRAYRTSRPA